jgi:hypothetical protein
MPLAAVCHHRNHSRCQHHSHIVWWIVVCLHHLGRPQPSSLSSASSISLPPPSPLYCHAFLLLLCPFSVEAAYFSVSSPSPPKSPPPSPSPSYLHRILFDCCVLMVVVVVHRCIVSLSTHPPFRRSRRHLVRQPPTAVFHFLLEATSSSHPN